jgi:small subunit ribosomal protein S16
MALRDRRCQGLRSTPELERRSAFWQNDPLRPDARGPLTLRPGNRLRRPRPHTARHVTITDIQGDTTLVAVKIRLKRIGKIRTPFYRIVVADSRKKRDGRVIEEIGTYNPKTEPSTIRVESERAQYWLGVGAQPTEAVAAILKLTGDIGGQASVKEPDAKADKAALFDAALKDIHAEPKAAKKSAAKKSAQKTAEKADDKAADEPEAEKKPKAKKAKAEEPADEPKAEEAPVEEPPKTEEASVEEPKAEEIPVEEPKAEETPAEEPKADEPPAEESKADEKTEA